MTENKKIKEVRKALGLSQQKMADALSVSKQYLSRVESGRTGFSKEKIILLCKTFNISADWLLMDKGFMHLEKTKEYKYNLTPDEKEYLDKSLETYKIRNEK